MIKLDQKVLLRYNKDKVKDKRILVRVDYNIDCQNPEEQDLFRIKQSIPTIKFLLENKAKNIILITHLGRPQKFEKKFSTLRLLPFLKKFFKNIEYFYWKGEKNLPDKKILILENIRFFKEEERLNYSFVKKLSSLGDIFVNEAFSASHRKHSSTYGLSKFLPTYFGFNFEEEIKKINLIFDYLNKRRGVGVIIGGLKFETKIKIIEKFLKKAEIIIIVGGLANTFLKAKGFEIGKSIFDPKYVKYLQKIYSNKILIPFDFITPQGKKYLGEIKKNDIILDTGPESINIFIETLKKIPIIIWNGPLGKIEEKKYSLGTKYFAHKLLKLKSKKIIGGGDTLKVFKKLKSTKDLFFSTGGGALLYYLAYGTLPVFDF